MLVCYAPPPTCAQGGANCGISRQISWLRKPRAFPRVRPADTNAEKSGPEELRTSFAEFNFPLGLGSIKLTEINSDLISD